MLVQLQNCVMKTKGVGGRNTRGKWGGRM